MMIQRKFAVECDAAYNGEQALQKIEQRLNTCGCGYKIIFMDISMPLMDGFEATKAIRDIERQHLV